MLRKSLLLSCTILALGACSLAPDYQRPDLPTANAWPADTQAEAGKPLWTDMDWKQFFTDPTLQSVIQQALDNNRDLRVAALNIQVAQATYRVTDSDLYPHVDANKTSTEQLTPKALSVHDAAAGRHHPHLYRQCGGERLRAGLFRPPAQPERSGPGELSGHRGGPPLDPDQPDRRGGQRLSDLAGRPQAAGPDRGHPNHSRQVPGFDLA